MGGILNISAFNRSIADAYGVNSQNPTTTDSSTEKTPSQTRTNQMELVQTNAPSPPFCPTSA